MKAAADVEDHGVVKQAIEDGTGNGLKIQHATVTRLPTPSRRCLTDFIHLTWRQKSELTAANQHSAGQLGPKRSNPQTRAECRFSCISREIGKD